MSAASEPVTCACVAPLARDFTAEPGVGTTGAGNPGH